MKNKAPQDKKMQKMLPQVPQVETNAIEFWCICYLVAQLFLNEAI